MSKCIGFIFILIVCLISHYCHAKVRVLEIDTGVSKGFHQEIDTHLAKHVLNELDYTDSNGHGTHVAGIILKDVCSEIELESCSYFDFFSPKGNDIEYIKCLRNAILEKPDFINISSGGPGYDQEEYGLLNILSNLNIKIIVAAGNDSKDLSIAGNDYYPAKYKIANLIPVGNLNPFKVKNSSSNYGLPNEVWEIGTEIRSTLNNGKYGYMSGTSMSAAAYTNKLLKEKCAKLHEKTN